MTGKPRPKPAPILDRDTGRRLDAIVRRHGGTSRPAKPEAHEAGLPPVKRRQCRGQLDLFGVDDDDTA